MDFELPVKRFAGISCLLAGDGPSSLDTSPKLKILRTYIPIEYLFAYMYVSLNIYVNIYIYI